MKRKLISLVIVGIMLISNCIPVFASVNSVSKYGTTTAFRATGTIKVDNVNNIATATVSTNTVCGIQATAIFRYSNGQISSGPMSTHGRDCMASIQKVYVQAVGATGIFTVTKDGYSWSDTADVSVN